MTLGYFCKNRSLAILYFRMATCHTLIDAKRFHFRVRDGIGWFTLAMFTKQTGAEDCSLQRSLTVCQHHPRPARLQGFTGFDTSSGFSTSRATLTHFAEICLSCISFSFSARHSKRIGCYMVKPHGSLVHVSFAHYWTSTPCLSTL